MPITLDPSLPPSLYPLAWLVGSWQGSGAVHQPTPEGAIDRRIEQRLDCLARADGTLAWTSVVHVLDDPAPLPPTSVFTSDDAPTPAPSGTGERSLLMRESGVWTVGDPLPGQDLTAAEEAPPGDPASFLSYGLEARFDPDRRPGSAGSAAPAGDPGSGAREPGGPEVWAGEVRGPRIQLALRAPQPAAGAGIAATRMFGYVGGRLMWLWERRPESGASGTDLSPYLSVELDRV